MTQQDSTSQITTVSLPHHGNPGCESNSHYEPGQIIDGTYQLKELIGKGGMGYVFRAEHILIGHDYALKLLLPDQINETNWKRFQSEGKAIARLSHSNIVRIYNMGVDMDRCPFYVTDLLEGASLADVIRATGRLNMATTLRIFLQLCSGLSYAHQRGIIHRDIKPNNIILPDQSIAPLVDPDQVPCVKIVDFGIAKIVKMADEADQHITFTGQIFGTPIYMSPEQCMGSVVDARSEIYSLGCTLYETLTGRPPFCGQNAMETVLMHLQQEPLSLSQVCPEVEFSQSIELLVAKMLKKDPVQRYQSMDELSRDLERIKSGKFVVHPVSMPERFGPESEITEEHVGHDPENKSNLPDQERKYFRNGKDLALMVSGLALLACLGWWKVSACTQPSKVKPIAIDSMPVFNHLADEAKLISQVFAPIHSFSLGMHIKDGHHIRLFQFSKDNPVGQLTWNNDNKHCLAKGLVEIPAAEPITLQIQTANAYALELRPDLLQKFARTDISTLDLCTDSWGSILKQVTGWTNLNRLILRKTVLESSDIPLIDTLGALQSLKIDECEYPVDRVAKLKVLPHLKEFELVSKKNQDIIFKSLAGSRNLEWVNLDFHPNSNLTLSYLAQCPNINQLELGAEYLVEQDFLHLEKMHSLTFLRLINARLRPSSIAYLSRLHNLRTLVIDDLQWSYADRKRLKAQVPAYQPGPGQELK